MHHAGNKASIFGCLYPGGELLMERGVWKGVDGDGGSDGITVALYGCGDDCGVNVVALCKG